MKKRCWSRYVLRLKQITFALPCTLSKRWLRKISVLMKLFRLLPLGRFWKTIPSTVEGPVV